MFQTLALAIVLASAATSTEVTVYNQGFGLVKEERTLSLSSGRQLVKVEDVASRIEPTSVSIKSLGDKDAFTVLEQNYQYDLISPMAILAKSVGKRVSFTRSVGNTRETLTGVLLSSPATVVAGTGSDQATTYNGLVIKTDDGRIILNPQGEIVVLEIPEGLISKPTLLWDLEAAKAGQAKVELSYLTQGIDWEADYVVNLAPGGATANLTGWVTLDNQSGATYQDAKLKLLAGEVNRATNPRGAPGGMVAMEARSANKADFQEESLFEYHLYTLQRPATIRNNEIKQISLLEGAGIKVVKTLIADFSRMMRVPEAGEYGTNQLNPEVQISFQNSTANGLGMPMPQGKVKVYQSDKSGSMQMLGEDRIQHTPRNESLRLTLGRAFDVIATKKRTNYTKLGDRGARESYELEMRNRKEVEDTVTVYEAFYGQWKIVEKSQEFVKVNSERAAFVVKVGPDQVKKVTYTVETRW